MAIPVNLIDSEYSSILKILQEGKMQNTLPEQSVLWKYVKNLLSSEWEGKKLVRPLRTKYGMPAVGAIRYNQAFKQKSDASFALLEAVPKYVNAHIEIPLAVYNAGKSDRGSFIRPMKEEVEAKQIALARQLTRMAFGDGSGVLGTVSAAADSSNDCLVTIDTSNSAQGFVYWFELGDQISPYQSSGAARSITVAAGSFDHFRVKSIDEYANQVTLSPYDSSGSALNYTSGLVATDLLCRKGITLNVSGDSGTRSEELSGLEALISDSGTVHNIDRSANPSYKSYVHDGSTNLLSTDMLQRSVAQANKRGSGKIDAAFMNHDCYNRFVEIAEEDRRINSTADGTLGFKKIGYDSAWGTVRFEIDEFCRKDRIYCIDSRYFELVGRDFDMLDVGGSVIRLAPSVSGGFEQSLSSELYGEMELFCTHPAASAKVTNFSLA